MMTLYHCMSARSFRPLWMLEELGLEYELVVLPFPPRERARDYLNMNPLGTIPLFIDGDTRMTESAAICEYLCATHAPTSLQVQVGEPGFGAYLNYLDFGEATLTFPQALVLRYSRFEPTARQQPQVAQDYARWFLARLRTLEPRLRAEPWLCAGRFTAADVSVGYALMVAQHLGLSAQFTAAVAAYWQRLRARAGFQQALQVQDAAARQQGVPTTAAMDTLPSDRNISS